MHGSPGSVGEQDRRNIKRCSRPMLGFKSFRTARIVLGAASSDSTAAAYDEGITGPDITLVAQHAGDTILSLRFGTTTVEFAIQIEGAESERDAGQDDAVDAGVPVDGGAGGRAAR